MAALNDKLVFGKTAKGAAEVATRGGALTMAARRVLIMVDGKRSLAELHAMLRNNELDGLIGLLEAQGFIQRVGSDSAINDEPQREAREAATPTREGGRDALEVNTVGSDLEGRPLVTIEEAKRRAVRELTERLGPDAEIMSVRLEQARTAEELRERLREAERLVAGLLGESAAESYLRALRTTRR